MRQRRSRPRSLADAMIRQSAALDGPARPRASSRRGSARSTWRCTRRGRTRTPRLGVAQVDRGSDAYIEGRIIERLDDPLVVRALPVLACAGRCRVATIAQFLDCDPDAGGTLAAQEWVDAAASGQRHVRVPRQRWPGGCAGTSAPGQRRAEFAARSAALASSCCPVREAPLADIDVDELIAALRLSPPAEAAALWDSIADRAMEPPGRWGTVLNMTRRILGEWEEEAWPTMPRVARHRDRRAHRGEPPRPPLFDARAYWETVRVWANEHPDPSQAAPDDACRPRAVALQARRRACGGFSVEAHSAAPPAHHPELLSAAASGDRAPPPGIWPPGAASAMHHTPGTNTRHCHGGRTWPGRGRPGPLPADDPPRLRSGTPGTRGKALVATAPESSWPDSILPGDLLARIRIEHGLIAPPDDLSVLNEWEATRPIISTPPTGSASPRSACASACATASSACPSRSAGKPSTPTPGRVPTCTAHDLIPPLCVSVAEAWMSAGQPDRALDLLGRRRSEALGTRLDEATVRHADAATVEIVRRLRLANPSPSCSGWLKSANPPSP